MWRRLGIAYCCIWCKQITIDPADVDLYVCKFIIDSATSKAPDSDLGKNATICYA